jgi:hypothetical protein
MLEFFFWDVQHGHATYVHTPNDRHMVVDLGIGSFSTRHEFSPLQYLRSHFGVNQLDYVVITHPHRDHIDDIYNFDRMNPLILHRPRHLTEQDIRAGNKPGDFEKVDKYVEIDGRYNASVVGTPGDVTVPANWGGVNISFFSPSGCNRGNLNNHSLVVVFEYLGFKVVIPGDNQEESWQELLLQDGFRRACQNAYVLLAPHHGRRAGFCADLLSLVDPNIVVISDGPEGETSCTGDYARYTSGWRAYYPDNTWDTRYCVTTRCDGMIRVQIYTANDGSNRLNVFLSNGSGKNRD